MSTVNKLLRASAWRDGDYKQADHISMELVWECEGRKYSTAVTMSPEQRLELIEKLQSAAS